MSGKSQDFEDHESSGSDTMSPHPTQNGSETEDVRAFATEALSQYPSPNGELSDGDCAEIALVGGSERRASICNPILWQEIVTETAADPLRCLLLSTIKQGFLRKCAR